VTLDTAMAKRLAASAGVATPRFAVVERPEDLGRLAALDLAWPRIAKPLCEGSSIGIRRSSRAADAAALEREVLRIAGDYAQPVLVEEFCAGPEFTVGVLGTGERARAIGAMEIVPRRGRPEEFVYSLEAKRDWQNEVEYHVPPRRDARTVERVLELAVAAHRALGCRDVSRVDVRLDGDGSPRFLEVNPLPGLNPVTGDLVILAGRSGLPYRELVGAIVAEALARGTRAADPDPGLSARAAARAEAARAR
jgi:D-alanine-D-alanine ligase